jgi:hypothetical protein
MKLHDSLQCCLLAVAARYPQHVLHINENILGPQAHGAEGWVAEEMIEMLEQVQPDILEEPAILMIDMQRSEIYIPKHSRIEPGIRVFCRGKLPECRNNTAKLQKLRLPAEETVKAAL